jgi:hypothetical protein
MGPCLFGENRDSSPAGPVPSPLEGHFDDPTGAGDTCRRQAWPGWLSGPKNGSAWTASPNLRKGIVFTGVYCPASTWKRSAF